ncbi:MAG: NAD-dependent epimerase/dehydratase family protein [Acidimicrobiales bacterium]
MSRSPAASVLLIGGTGPTGPAVAKGLEQRGFKVTILHSGKHEVLEVGHLRHLHGDAFDGDSLRSLLDGETFDVTLAMYGRLRSIAEVMQGRTGRLLSIGGAPVYRGFFDPAVHAPPGLPVPTREDAPLADEGSDGKSYRIGRTEQIVFDWHPTATHFRYPYVYGPRQLAPREWCFVRRILDRRSALILADGGLTLVPYGYVDNLAHAILLAVDQPEASMGEIFNCGDDEQLTVRQVAEVIAEDLDHEWEILSIPAELAWPARPLVQCYRNTHRVLDCSKLRERLGYRDAVPARDAVRLAARWLVDNPPDRGGYEEMALQDPFDYAAEDRIAAWWRDAVASFPELGYDELPGFGKSYAGPDTRHPRAETRI